MLSRITTETNRFAFLNERVFICRSSPSFPDRKTFGKSNVQLTVWILLKDTSFFNHMQLGAARNADHQLHRKNSRLWIGGSFLVNSVQEQLGCRFSNLERRLGDGCQGDIQVRRDVQVIEADQGKVLRDRNPKFPGSALYGQGKLVVGGKNCRRPVRLR